MDRGRRRAAGMPHPVDRRAVEVEAVTGRTLPGAHLDPPLVVAIEVVLAQASLAHEDRPGRKIVVVVAGVLRVEPADQPDVDVRVAVELCEVPRLRIVTNVLGPEARLAAERGREGVELLPGQVLARSDARMDPVAELCHSRAVI